MIFFAKFVCALNSCRAHTFCLAQCKKTDAMNRNKLYIWIITAFIFFETISCNFKNAKTVIKPEIKQLFPFALAIGKPTNISDYFDFKSQNSENVQLIIEQGQGFTFDGSTITLENIDFHQNQLKFIVKAFDGQYYSEPIEVTALIDTIYASFSSIIQQIDYNRYHCILNLNTNIDDNTIDNFRLWDANHEIAFPRLKYAEFLWAENSVRTRTFLWKNISNNYYYAVLKIKIPKIEFIIEKAYVLGIKSIIEGESYHSDIKNDKDYYCGWVVVQRPNGDTVNTLCHQSKIIEVGKSKYVNIGYATDLKEWKIFEVLENY